MLPLLLLLLLLLRPLLLLRCGTIAAAANVPIARP
jgi:hypothetical protein